MNTKIFASLATIAVVATAAVGGTIAYFSSTQVSTNNIIKAGSINLQIDHTKQTYNGVDCKTCSVAVISDTSNMVVAKNSVPNTPYNAVLVTPLNPAWTANITGATWIWATNPTVSPADTQNDTAYTFEKTFQWMGPATGAVLALGVAADNSYAVMLNGVQIKFDNGEFNYTAAGQDSVNLTLATGDLNQGTNTLSISVLNMKQVNGNAGTNPGGLLYKLTINGNCDSDAFKTTCQLWQAGDFTNQKFFNFNDVKPGDLGVNVISLHVTSNDAFVCMYAPNQIATPNPGHLADYIKFYVWNDDNGNGVQDGSESAIGGVDTLAQLNAYLGTVLGNSTKYLGIKWCFGEFGSNYDTCNGLGANDHGYNLAQNDQLQTDLGFYAVQTRNNTGFTCPAVMPAQ